MKSKKQRKYIFYKIIIFIVIFGVCIVILGSVKSRNINIVKYEVLSLINKDNFDNFQLHIGLDDLKELENGEKFVKANFIASDVSYDVKMKSEGNRWLIEIKNGEAWQGMSKFSMQILGKDELLTKHLFYQMLRSLDVLSYRTHLMNGYLNGEAMGIIYIEELLSLELLESMGRRESKIFTLNEIANRFDEKIPFCQIVDCALYAKKSVMMQVFDIQKSENGDGNFYKNPVSGLFEPIGYINSKKLDDNAFKDKAFHSYYLNEINKYKDNKFVNALFEQYFDKWFIEYNIVKRQYGNFELNIFDSLLKNIQQIILIADNFALKYDYEEKLFTDKSHPFLIIDKKNKVITIPRGTFELTTPLIVPRGYLLVAESGVSLMLGSKMYITSYSPIKFIGTKDNPIRIGAKNVNKEWLNITVINAGERSILEHVIISGGSEKVDDDFNITGGITFLKSDVDIRNVLIENMNGEDALNIVQSNFCLENTTINGTKADAFDSDFSNGSIDKLTFDNIGNDAIDVSGSQVSINNTDILNAGDKGISAGEGSTVTIENSIINDSFIGLASKDLSRITAINVDIGKTYFSLAAYRKKNEYGPGQIEFTTANNLIPENVLIQQFSDIFINGKKLKYNRDYGHDVFEELSNLQINY
ncbi:glycoside hydrolase family 55 protein [Patescibacteria group bacterium]|nr:glycoside hydrolase family 55 protein [Patescibacteria group bacterium]